MKTLFFLFASILLNTITFSQSPYGNGTVLNQIIGNLINPSANFQSNSGYGYLDYFPDPQTTLGSNTNDLYIPSTYDGSEPYGLVVYINSDDNGGVKSDWIQVFEEDKLIWIAPDNIGNSVNIDIRMATAWAALLRMKELFNIDVNRIYTSGQSGGARMAQTLAYIYPEVITGTAPICGASYPTAVAQDYETQNPNSNYEVILNFTAADRNYIKSFDRPYAIMTSFDDFREGDIMNIYYNGFELHGFDGKFLEIPGNHCASNTQHFRNAISFVEHPDLTVQEDNFSSSVPTTGNGYYSKNSVVSNNALILGSNQSIVDSIAYLKMSRGFDWNNRYGAILEYSFKWNSTLKTPVKTAVWNYIDDATYCENDGQNSIGENSIELEFNSQNGLIQMVILSKKINVNSDTLYKGQFIDWDGNTPINLKWHLWNDELRIECSKHMNSIYTLSSKVKLLDDSRAICIKWNDLIGTGTGNYWGSQNWQQGAYFTISSETGASGSIVSFDDLKLIATSNDFLFQPTPFITLTNNNGTLTGSTGFDSYDWYLNDSLIQSGPSNELMVNLPGTYHVIGLMNNQCESISNSISIDFNGLFSENSLKPIEIYPNPSDGLIYVLIDNQDSYFSLGYTISSMSGTIVQKDEMFSKNTIDISHLDNGVYFISIGESTFKVIKN